MDWSVGYLKEIGLMAAPGAAPPAAAAPAKAAKAAAPAKAAPSKGSSAKPPLMPAAAPAAPAAPAPEKSAAELAKMSKEERKAYHEARRAAGAGPAAAPKAKQMSKAERRAAQEGQRKAKEDQKAAAVENSEMLEELKLQGLSEEQAREVMAELARTGQEAEEEEAEEDEPEDLLSSVRKWLAEQGGKVPEDALHDFNMKVRFQGHVDTTPPDHLKCILQLIVVEALQSVDLAEAKLQPTAVAKKLEPAVARWAPLLEPLYGKIGDPMEAADVVVSAVLAGVTACEAPEAGAACGLVGSLMALREIDMIEDEDLLTGCRRAEHRSRVMDKFIEFLEDELDDEEDDEEDED